MCIGARGKFVSEFIQDDIERLDDRTKRTKESCVPVREVLNVVKTYAQLLKTNPEVFYTLELLAVSRLDALFCFSLFAENISVAPEEDVIT